MCDCLVALAPHTADGVTLFAKNSDRPPLEQQVIEWSPARRERRTQATHVAVHGFDQPTLRCVISRPTWCWGAEHGVNEAGVAVGNEAIYTTLDPRRAPAALTGMDLVRLALERASTAAAAVQVVVDLLGRYGQGGSGHDPASGPARPYWSSLLIADPTTAWIVETSGNDYDTLQVHDVAAISNRTCIPVFDAAHRHPKQPVERLVDPRRNASLAVLAKQPVSTQSLQAHLRSHDSCAEPGWSVCMHVPDVEQTTASMTAELRPDGGSVAHLLLGSPCANEYQTYTF